MKTPPRVVRRLADDKGATDPILVIAGIAITLVLLVGGTFAVSGVIGSAHDVNAKSDLDRIATAQAAAKAEKGAFSPLNTGPGMGAEDLSLARNSVGFTPTAGNNTRSIVSANSWAAATKSATGHIFFRSSASTTPFEIDSNGSKFLGPWEDTGVRNYFNNPGADQASGTNFFWMSGDTKGTAEQAQVPVTWSESKYAASLTVTSASKTTPNKQAILQWNLFPSMEILVGRRNTMSVKVFSTQPFKIGDVGMWSSVGTTVHATNTSGGLVIPANTPTTVYVTFTSTNKNLIMEFPVSGLVDGQTIQTSTADEYIGDYDPNHKFLWAWMDKDPKTSVWQTWPHAEEGAIYGYREQTRALILEKPAGIQIPADMTWTQVALMLESVIEGVRSAG